MADPTMTSQGSAFAEQAGAGALAGAAEMGTAGMAGEQHAGAAQAGLELLGMAPFQWVSVAMATLLLIAFGWLKVHRMIADGLDARIAAIKANLAEAEQLRAEAEALRDEYAARIAGAEQDAEAMLAHAGKEAEAIIAAARQSTSDMIRRREQMVHDKIAAAERQALGDLHNRAALSATRAAAALIAARHDRAADSALADEAIARI